MGWERVRVRFWLLFKQKPGPPTPAVGAPHVGGVRLQAALGTPGRNGTGLGVLGGASRGWARGGHPPGRRCVGLPEAAAAAAARSCTSHRPTGSHESRFRRSYHVGPLTWIRFWWAGEGLCEIAPKKCHLIKYSRNTKICTASTLEADVGGYMIGKSSSSETVQGQTPQTPSGAFGLLPLVPSGCWPGPQGPTS